jgi:hypothetical protein
MTQRLARHLYVLRLDGPADAFLGLPSQGRRIVKIGLAASPESRRSQFQAALPRGAFNWKTHRTTFTPGQPHGWPFDAAEAGEYAMKKFLAVHGDHLDGEFYLAHEADIDEAWRLGVAVAQAFGQTGKQL